MRHVQHIRVVSVGQARGWTESCRGVAWPGLTVAFQAPSGPPLLDARIGARSLVEAVAQPLGCAEASEWGDLFLGVVARLRRAALTPLPASAPLAGPWPEQDGLAQVALECAQALAQLQAEGERDHRESMMALQAVQEALVAARLALRKAEVALAGSRVSAKRAQHQARHDALTSLPNRAFFNHHLSQAVASHQPDGPGLAVIFLDLDGFKPINDTHGHDVGDELLGILALRLRRAVRAQDMMSRLGGDEFACLVMEGFDRAQLARLADKLFATVAAPLTLGSLVLSVRPSIGMALCPEDGQTAGSLLQHADRAMYRAKRLQCRHAFYDAALDA